MLRNLETRYDQIHRILSSFFAFFLHSVAMSKKKNYNNKKVHFITRASFGRARVINLKSVRSPC